MKTFIFYTMQGYTESPSGKCVENVQMLGRARGNNVVEARNNLINENPWITSVGFIPENIFAEQVIDKELRNNIRTVVEYLWRDEKKHYEEDRCEDHIFNTLKKLKKAANSR